MITILANTAFKPFAPVFTLQTVEAAAVATLKISVDGITYTDYPGGAAETFTGSQVFSDYPTGAFLKCNVDVYCTVPCVIVPLTYTVTVTAANCSIVAKNNVSASYSSGVYSFGYEAGTACTLQCTPNKDFRFEGWADGYEDSTRTFFVNGDMSFTVTCPSDLTTYTFFNDTHCTCSPSEFSGHPGDKVTVTVTPNAGYSFNAWGDGVTDNPRTFTLGYRNLKFGATAWASEIEITADFVGVVKIKGVHDHPDTWYTWDRIGRPGATYPIGWVDPTGNQTVYTDARTLNTSIHENSGTSASIGTISDTESVSAPTFYLNNVGGNNPNLEVKCDGQDWQTAPTTSETAVSFTNTLKLRGSNREGFSHSESEYSQLVISGPITFVTGGVNALLAYGGQFIDHIPSAYCFYKLFAGSSIRTVANLTLPSKELSYACYQEMFAGCAQMTSAPSLPAAVLTTRGYHKMFQNCTSLVTAPALPATTVAEECYRQMFEGCTALTTAPAILPADNLPNYCYASMFNGCTALTNVPTLPATKIVGRDVYSWMFMGCTSLINASIVLNIDDISAYDSPFWCMFNGCTSLTTAPTINTTKVGLRAMGYMFKGCTSLMNGPDLLPRTLGRLCYVGMFNGCTQLNSLYCYAEDISASECLSGWLDGVAATGTFHRATDNKWSVLWERTANGIPEGWTVTPEFPWIELTSTDATLYMKHEGKNYPNLYYYVFGDAYNQWNGVSTNSNNPTVLPNNHKVWLRAENTGWSWSSDTRSRLIFGDNGSTGSVSITAGSVMSLICKSGYEVPTELPNSYCFNGLFEGIGTGNNQNRLSSVSSGFLPATTMSDYCYSWMFKNSRVVTPPALPATSLAGYCYNQMFYECNYLTSVPVLPATSLEYDCYLHMFEGCTSLTDINVNMLHATTLASAACEGMFKGCTNLTAAPLLLSHDVPQYAYKCMFENCSKIALIYCYCRNRTGKEAFDYWFKNAGGSAASTPVFHGTAVYNFNRDHSGVPAGWTYLKDLE